jgi:hypothetical protein
VGAPRVRFAECPTIPPAASCLTSAVTALWLPGESCRRARILGSILLISMLAVRFLELTSPVYYVAALWVCKRGAGLGTVPAVTCDVLYCEIYAG